MATTETKAELGRQIVEDAKRYVLYSWSVQDAINPIPVERAEGGTALVPGRRHFRAIPVRSAPCNDTLALPPRRRATCTRSRLTDKAPTAHR